VSFAADDRSSSGPQWTERIKSLVDETVERSTTSTLKFERLLLAASAPGFDPQAWTNELNRLGTERGAETYQQLSDITVGMTSEGFRLVARYLDAYLRALVPDEYVGRVGPPPAMPPAPASADTLAWTAWYQRYATWASEQQAWSVRLVNVLREEVAAGHLRADDLQTSSRSFLERSLPDYLLAMAELNLGVFADVLGIADDSLERLADALLADDEPDSLVIDVHGETGTTVSVDLVVENRRPQAATITIENVPLDGFTLRTTPSRFELEPDQARPVSIGVGLPAEATPGPIQAGSVIIRGQDERDLVVRILADADAPAQPAGDDSDDSDDSDDTSEKGSNDVA
jgi:hypothetical protein